MFFAVYYGGLFVLVSITLAVVCLSVPKLRPYTLRALVGPVAFGFCAAWGLVIAQLALDALLPSQLAEPPSWMNYILAAVAYVGSGAVGVWIAFAVLRSIEVGISTRTLN
jgi:hypothetical protein